MKIRCGRVTSGRKKCRRVLATVSFDQHRLLLVHSEQSRQAIEHEALSAADEEFWLWLRSMKQDLEHADCVKIPLPTYAASAALVACPRPLLVGSDCLVVGRSCLSTHAVGMTPHRLFEVHTGLLRRRWDSHQLDIELEDLNPRPIEAGELLQIVEGLSAIDLSSLSRQEIFDHWLEGALSSDAG